MIKPSNLPVSPLQIGDHSRSVAAIDSLPIRENTMAPTDSQCFNQEEEIFAYLHQLKESLFSGSIRFSTAKGVSWKLYFRLGRLVWQAGGVAPHRQWQRYLQEFCNISSLKTNPAPGNGDGKETYQALAALHQNNQLDRQSLESWIANSIRETLFDIIQSCHRDRPLSCQMTAADMPNLLLVLIQTEAALSQVQRAWKAWRQAGWGNYSPNEFPAIANAKRLREQLSAADYRSLVSLVDGTKTMRCLATKRHQDLIALAQELMPLVEAGILNLAAQPRLHKISLELLEPEAPAPTVHLLPDSPTGNLNHRDRPGDPKTLMPLVACVDDSPLVCDALEKILTENGYRFLKIQDSLQAIPQLLKNKPDFVFLDLLMPVVSGYEICAQLKRTPSFANVPIVILTSKDGLVDRMRAKIVGSSDFLAKPVNPESTLKILEKHLHIRR